MCSDSTEQTKQEFVSMYLDEDDKEESPRVRTERIKLDIRRGFCLILWIGMKPRQWCHFHGSCTFLYAIEVIVVKRSSLESVISSSTMEQIIYEWIPD